MEMEAIVGEMVTDSWMDIVRYNSLLLCWDSVWDISCSDDGWLH